MMNKKRSSVPSGIDRIDDMINEINRYSETTLDSYTSPHSVDSSFRNILTAYLLYRKGSLKLEHVKKELLLETDMLKLRLQQCQKKDPEEGKIILRMIDRYATLLHLIGVENKKRSA